MQKVGLACKMLGNKPHFTKVNVLIKSENNIRFAELLRTDRAKLSERNLGIFSHNSDLVIK